PTHVGHGILKSGVPIARWRLWCQQWHVGPILGTLSRKQLQVPRSKFLDPETWYLFFVETDMRLTAVFASVVVMFGIGCSGTAIPVVVMETTEGTIRIELYEDQAPITVKNFLDYVDAKHFDGLIFHRVVRKSDDGRGIAVIQGGGFMPDMKQRETKKPIK